MRRTKLWLTTMAALLCSIMVSAHDFEVGGIYYNITSETDLTVEVTYKGSASTWYQNEYTGVITIPETVTYKNNTYQEASHWYGNFAIPNDTEVYDSTGTTKLTDGFIIVYFKK